MVENTYNKSQNSRYEQLSPYKVYYYTQENHGRSYQISNLADKVHRCKRELEFLHVNKPQQPVIHRRNR